MSMITLGVVMVTSAGMTIDPDREVSIRTILFSRTTAYALLAIGAMIGMAFSPVGRWVRDPSPVARVRAAGARFGSPHLWLPITGLVGLLLLVYVPALSHPVNGSYRWVEINIPGAPALSFQPSELVKWAVIPVVAWYAAVSRERLADIRYALLPALGAVGVLAGVIILEDLGTGLLVMAASGIILIAGGAHLRHLALLTPPALAAVGIAIISSPYRVRRLMAFMDPFADAEGTGYHILQSLGAISNGGVSGRGLGHGLQKFGYLPEDTTDFLFSVICEELGVAGAALVLALFAALLLSGRAIVRAQPSLVGKLYGVGVLTTIGLQGVMNLFVVTGLAPTKGIALPLLSAGGTGWILTCVSLGVLVSLDFHAGATTAEEPVDSDAEMEPITCSVEHVAS